MAYPIGYQRGTCEHASSALLPLHKLQTRTCYVTGRKIYMSNSPHQIQWLRANGHLADQIISPDELGRSPDSMGEWQLHRDGTLHKLRMRLAEDVPRVEETCCSPAFNYDKPK